MKRLFKIPFFSLLLSLLLVCAAQGQSTSSVRSDGTILVDGQPFFPFGYYGPQWRSSFEAKQTAINILAEAGFNTIVLEDIATSKFGELLDQADNQNVKVLVGLTNLKGNEYPEGTLNSYQDRPAVLGWSLMDDGDNGEWTLSEIRARNSFIKAKDPDHITYQTLTGYYPSRRKAVGQYASLSDAIALQIYPIGTLPDYDVTEENALTQTYLRTLQYVLAAEQNNTAMVMNLQTFQWGKDRTPISRYPTVKELRNMCYSGLAAGVKGIISYTYSSDLYNNQKALWNEHLAIKNDVLKRTANFYLDGDLTRYDTGDPELVASYYTHEEKLLLLVVNTSYSQSKQANIVLPAGYQSATPLFDRMSATLSQTGSVVSGTVTPQAVQVYQLTKNAKESAGTGLSYALYGNKTLSGNPIQTGTDATVNFDWQYGGKTSGQPSDNFSVRWTGQVKPAYSEEYTFYTRADDGTRLWVNDQLLVNDWSNHAVREKASKITLEAGKKYNIKLEYFENVGAAVCKLLWSSPSQSKQVIPAANLYPVSLDDEPTTTYTVRARGVQGTEKMALLIGGNTVKSWTVSTSMQDYNYQGKETGTVRLAIANDQGKDHDLVVDKLTVDGTVYQAEDQPVNTGVWQNGCGGSYSEWLHCSGYIAFDLTTTARQASQSLKQPISQANSEVLIYPNPSQNGSFTVQGSEIDNSQVSLYNLHGQRIPVSQQSAQPQQVQVQPQVALPPGLYIVRVRTSRGAITQHPLFIE